MAKAAIRMTEDGKFRGQLSDGHIERIRKIRNVEEVPSFTHEIFEFPVWYREEARNLDKSAYQYAVDSGELDNYRGELRAYQTKGAAFLYVSPRSMLGDAAGIGKTPQVCGMLNKVRSMNLLAGRETKRILVAAENSAVGQIASEIERFTGYRVSVLHSVKPKMLRQTARFYVTHECDGSPIKKKSIDFEVLVITHSTLRSDTFFTWFSRVVHKFDTFVLDESYVVKNPDTVISGFVKVLCSKMSRVHFLNATVFETKLIDVINQFNLCYPGLLPTLSWVERNFCVYRMATYPIRNGGGILGNRRELVSYRNQEFFKAALELVYLTRKKNEVKASNTERFYETYVIKQTKAQKAAIRQGYRYFEVLNCPSLCPELEIPNDIQNVPKFARLMDLMEESFEGQKVMIYVWHLEIQQAIKENLEKMGCKTVILNGSTKERDAIREDFNSDIYDVIITNAKRSLNLYGGDVCIFYSVETNPANIEQIAARIDRNVDDSSKTFVLLAYEGEEVNFFINTVEQRSQDSADLTDVVSETVLQFGRLLKEQLSKE